MELFRPDKKWPEPLPEKEVEKNPKEVKSEKSEENPMIDIEEEKKRIKRLEEDQKHFQRSIAELTWKLGNTKDKLKKEDLERQLKNEKEYLEWTEKWIKQAEEKIEKAKNKEK